MCIRDRPMVIPSPSKFPANPARFDPRTLEITEGLASENNEPFTPPIAVNMPLEGSSSNVPPEGSPCHAVSSSISMLDSWCEIPNNPTPSAWSSALLEDSALASSRHKDHPGRRIINNTAGLSHHSSSLLTLLLPKACWRG
eukprot:TRINITY_DN2215_c0_g1_i5.p1 TRINITY_DN2215_c0_g1~~TRINITY_DN2215_c0_g1_i5.p1  ORF type:complete len:141 (+),score=15.50 TRINITY_DN2215_c0_g1_i5:67-489(+)